MRSTFAFVDVHFGADHDWNARENRGEPAVQARGKQERVHNLRIGLPQICADACDVEWTAQSGLEPEHIERRAGGTDFLADRARLVDAADHRLESRRQVAHQIEHHFLGTADHECVREIDNANAVHFGLVT